MSCADAIQGSAGAILGLELGKSGKQRIRAAEPRGLAGGGIDKEGHFGARRACSRADPGSRVEAALRVSDRPSQPSFCQPLVRARAVMLSWPLRATAPPMPA